MQSCIYTITQCNILLDDVTLHCTKSPVVPDLQSKLLGKLRGIKVFIMMCPLFLFLLLSICLTLTHRFTSSSCSLAEQHCAEFYLAPSASSQPLWLSPYPVWQPAYGADLAPPPHSDRCFHYVKTTQSDIPILWHRQKSTAQKTRGSSILDMTTYSR